MHLYKLLVGLCLIPCLLADPGLVIAASDVYDDQALACPLIFERLSNPGKSGVPLHRLFLGTSVIHLQGPRGSYRFQIPASFCEPLKGRRYVWLRAFPGGKIIVRWSAVKLEGYTAASLGSRRLLAIPSELRKQAGLPNDPESLMLVGTGTTMEILSLEAWHSRKKTSNPDILSGPKSREWIFARRSIGLAFRVSRLPNAALRHLGIEQGESSTVILEPRPAERRIRVVTAKAWLSQFRRREPKTPRAAENYQRSISPRFYRGHINADGILMGLTPAVRSILHVRQSDRVDLIHTGPSRLDLKIVRATRLLRRHG